ncbi:TetR family transcriptional regulator [Aeromicrobium sp.]|nr:TetR family transcriptional regulator [Aeromicrobium sp.]
MPSLGVDALLDAAEREFAGGGFDGGSLRSIMREADADPGAIY